MKIEKNTENVVIEEQGAKIKTKNIFLNAGLLLAPTKNAKFGFYFTRGKTPKKRSWETPPNHKKYSWFGIDSESHSGQYQNTSVKSIRAWAPFVMFVFYVKGK